LPNPFRQAVKRSFELSMPRRLFVVRGSARSRTVALTFDDGPHPEHTNQVLDVLRAAGVRATFFVVGQNVARHPSVVARISAEGHELGQHSFTHGEPASTSAETLAREIDETTVALEKCCGATTRFFRPPHGKVTPGKLMAAWRRRMGVALWSTDPKDFAESSAEGIRQYFRRHPIQGGDIVLLHDTSRNTVEALPDIIDGVTRAGLTFVPLRELVG